MDGLELDALCLPDVDEDLSLVFLMLMMSLLLMMMMLMMLLMMLMMLMMMNKCTRIMCTCTAFCKTEMKRALLAESRHEASSRAW